MELLPIYDTTENRMLCHKFYTTLPCPPKNHCIRSHNQWCTMVRCRMDIELLPYLKKIGSPKMPLYFNAFLIMAFNMSYPEMNEYIHGLNIQFAEMVNCIDECENTRCCCSHSISQCFWYRAPLFQLFTGCDCILKHNFVDKKTMDKLRRASKKKILIPKANFTHVINQIIHNTNRREYQALLKQQELDNAIRSLHKQELQRQYVINKTIEACYYIEEDYYTHYYKLV